MDRQLAHELLDQLSLSQFAIVSHLLEILADQWPVALAPSDGDPVVTLQAHHSGEGGAGRGGKLIRMEDVIANSSIQPHEPG